MRGHARLSVFRFDGIKRYTDVIGVRLLSVFCYTMKYLFKYLASALIAFFEHFRSIA